MFPKLFLRCSAHIAKSSLAPLQFLTLLSAALISCAAPGQPTPPHPPVPQPINDLAVRQRGSSVVLSFTVPTKTTRGEKLPAVLSVDVYRASSAPSATSVPNLQLISTVPAAALAPNAQDGRAELSAPIPPGAPAGQPFSYSVRTSVSKKRSSADSNLATLRVLPPPSAPADLRAEVTESAIRLQWTGAAHIFRVYRCEAAAATPTQSQAPPCAPASPLKLLGESPASSFSDAQFNFGATYIYTVRAVASAESTQIESDDSSPLVVTPKDTFSPSAPADLVASIIRATISAPAYVELSWEINPETDLAGYFLYRSEGQDQAGQRLSSRLLLAPAFRDITVIAGRKYFYRVTAVDRAGNESKLSSPVEVDVPQQ